MSHILSSSTEIIVSPAERYLWRAVLAVEPDESWVTNFKTDVGPKLKR